MCVWGGGSGHGQRLRGREGVGQHRSRPGLGGHVALLRLRDTLVPVPERTAEGQQEQPRLLSGQKCPAALPLRPGSRALCPTAAQPSVTGFSVVGDSAPRWSGLRV